MSLHDIEAERISLEWILPLSKEELKAFDKLAKEYEKNKISRAYSAGSGAAIIINKTME